MLWRLLESELWWYFLGAFGVSESWSTFGTLGSLGAFASLATSRSACDLALLRFGGGMVSLEGSCDLAVARLAVAWVTLLALEGGCDLALPRLAVGLVSPDETSVVGAMVWN